jgi:hypothetical protein
MFGIYRLMQSIRTPSCVSGQWQSITLRIHASRAPPTTMLRTKVSALQPETPSRHAVDNAACSSAAASPPSQQRWGACGVSALQLDDSTPPTIRLLCKCKLISKSLFYLLNAFMITRADAVCFSHYRQSRAQPCRARPTCSESAASVWSLLSRAKDDGIAKAHATATAPAQRDTCPPRRLIKHVGGTRDS